jgi:hypothetical protein
MRNFTDTPVAADGRFQSAWPSQDSGRVPRFERRPELPRIEHLAAFSQWAALVPPTGQGVTLPARREQVRALPLVSRAEVSC